MSESNESGRRDWSFRTVLSADDCLFHRGPIAHPGRLEVGEDLLSFSPTRVLDRIAGAEDVELPIAEITEIAAGGIHHNLDITIQGKTLRFSGRGAMRVHARLICLLADGEDLPDGEKPLFEPGERVVLQGQGELYVNDLVAVRGEITLTDMRFRFMPGLGLERLLWNSAQIDVPLKMLHDWDLKGLRRLFSCTIEDRQIRVGGALAPDLYRHLETMGPGGEIKEDSGEESVIETWKVQYRRGPMAHPGDLSVSPSRVQFRPTGILDAVVGVQEFSVELNEVTSVTRRGWAETKVHLRAGHLSYTLNIPDHQTRFDGLVDLIRDRHLRDSNKLRAGDPSAYTACLDSWSERIRYDDSEQIVVSTVAAHSRSTSEVRFGWLLLTRSRLLFLPIGGPASKEEHMDLPLETICRLDGGPRTPGDQIYLSADEVPLRFMLAHKEGVVEEFWAQCRSPTRILSWATLGPRSLSRINGDARFIRIISHGEVVVDLSPGVTIPHSDGVAVMLPGEPGSSLPLEQWVTVEIGQAEGIYQFDSRVVRSAPIPFDMVVDDPDNVHLLISAFPNELRVYNQRNSYRVPTHMHLRAHVLAQVADGGSWMATGEALECDLLDLSIGGALVQTVHTIDENERLTLNLPLLDQWVEIRATCIRALPNETEIPGNLYGMEFRELTNSQEDLLHKAIMQLQREALVDKEGGEEGVED